MANDTHLHARESTVNLRITGTTHGSKRSLDVFDNASGTKTAFGELETESKVTLISASASYNLIPANFRTFSGPSGTATAEANEFKASCGATQFGYGAIQSFRSLNVQYGSGSSVRFGARFPDATLLTWQGVGLAGIGDEVSFGRNEEGSFGCWHRHGGFAEVRRFQVTTPASGAETLTFTVNGTIFTIPVTAGTAQKNAHEIATYIDDNSAAIDAFQNNDIVTISFLSDGPKSGTYSSSSTGTLVGTFTQVTAGVTKTSDFVEIMNSSGVLSSEYNGDIPIGFDPTKGNTYEISYSAGYGNINYYIFDFNDGQWMKAHTVKWQNSENKVNLNQPSMRAIIYCYSVGGTTQTSVYCPMIAAYVSGSTEPTRNPRSYSITKSIGSTETVLFQIRNRKIYNGLQNQAEIIPELLSVSSEGSKDVIIRIFGNAIVGGTPNFQDVGTNLIAEISSSGTTRTGGVPLFSTVVSPGGSQSINLESLRILIPPTLRFVITAQRGTGSAADVTASLVWLEDL